MYDTTPLHPPFTMPALCSFSFFTSGDSSLDRATHITVLRSSHSHTLSGFWSGCHPIERQTLSFRRHVMAHGSYPGPHPGPDLGAGHCSPLAAAPAHEVIRGTSAPCGSIRNSSPVVAVRCAWLGCDNTSHWSHARRMTQYDPTDSQWQHDSLTALFKSDAAQHDGVMCHAHTATLSSPYARLPDLPRPRAHMLRTDTRQAVERDY